MVAYQFEEQFSNGKSGEYVLDEYFAGFYDIQSATREQERCGIDRIFTGSSGKRFTVEYKTDTAAARTGNLFIETISVDTVPKLGWARTCSADYIILYIPGWQRAYIVKPTLIRARLPEWIRRYRLMPIDNGEYFTYGVPVPHQMVEALATRVIELRKAA